MIKKIQERIIPSSKTLIETLKKMDELDKKLLLVMDNGNYQGVISAGDIQRAIINNIDLNSKIRSILRKNVRVSIEGDSFDSIKSKMMEFRTEFMPILNEKKELVEVVFWEDIFEDQIQNNDRKINLPVVIMAGGKGSRLKPFTNIIPKPLIPIGEKPIVEVIMEKFNSVGMNEFYLTLNYKSDMLKYYIENNIKDYRINFIYEDQPLGTAGSLSLLSNKITSTFFVSNCDIIINEDYREIYDYHKKNNNELTAVGSVLNHSIPYGTFETGEDGRLLKLQEKPELNYLANTGVYLLESHLLNEIPQDTFFHITQLIEKILNRDGRVGIFPISEKSWIDIGEWKKYMNNYNIS